MLDHAVGQISYRLFKKKKKKKEKGWGMHLEVLVLNAFPSKKYTVGRKLA